MSHVRLSALLLAAIVAASLNACGDGKALTDPAPPVGPAASLSSIVDSVRIAFNLPAMGTAIVTLEDGIVAIGVAGTRRAAGGPAATAGDLWHLGSNTKAITSLLAAVAVSQNRIEWTTTIPQVFPELTNIRAEHRDVTLRELLSHQSGLQGSITPGVLGGWKDLTAVAQRDSVVAWLVQQPPTGSRGTFVYSNVGYGVAGAMLERVFGTSFEAATAAHVFAPLGMADAGFGPQAAAGSTTQPVGHYREGNGWRVLENHAIPPVLAPAGSAHMSLPSWGRLVREVLRVEAGTPTLAPAAIARETTTEVVPVGPGTSYGLGWGVTTRAWANGKVLYHSGSNGANFSVAVLAPQRNVAFLATTNGVDSNGPKAVNGLIGRLIAFHNTGK